MGIEIKEYGPSQEQDRTLQCPVDSYSVCEPRMGWLSWCRVIFMGMRERPHMATVEVTVRLRTNDPDSGRRLTHKLACWVAAGKIDDLPEFPL